MFSFVTSAIGMLCLIHTTTSSVAVPALFVLGSKFGISQALNLAYIGNILLFPTSFVATSFGICNIFARITTIFAPYLAELKPTLISQWTFVLITVLAYFASSAIRIKQF